MRNSVKRREEAQLLEHQGFGAGLRYGFNEPEVGYVWSTFNFGLTMRRNDSRAVIVANFIHSDGVLRDTIAPRVDVPTTFVPE